MLATNELTIPEKFWHNVHWSLENIGISTFSRPGAGGDDAASAPVDI